MPRRYVITLEDGQVRELEGLRDHHAKPYIRERAAAILKVHDGASARQVGREGLLRPRRHGTVCGWLHRYQQEGASGLGIRAGRGRKPAFSPHYPTALAAKEAVLAVAHQPPGAFGLSQSRWTLGLLRRTLPLLQVGTDSSLCHLLGRLGIAYKRGRHYLHSPDPDYRAKLAQLDLFLEQSRLDQERYPLLFLDELTFYRQPTLACDYEQQGHLQPLARRSYRSNTPLRVGAAMDALTGKVIYRQSYHVGCRELLRLYEAICQAYPKAERIYLVADNWPVHYHPDLLAALVPQPLPFPVHLARSWPKEPSAKAPKANLPIQMVQLPTYAPWTNPIEKLWRWLCQDLLHLHRLADDLDALKNGVASFLDQFHSGSAALLRYCGLAPP